MSEGKPENQTPQPQSKDGEQGKKPVEIKVSVDSEQMNIMMEQLKRAEKAKEEAEKTVAKNTDELRAKEDAIKKLTEESDDYKEKLKLISEKELAKKKAAIVERAKALIQDDARVKELEATLQDPEKVKATEYMLGVLEETMKKGEERNKALLDAEKKKAEEAAKSGQPAPAGSAPLNAAQMGQSASGFDSYEAMIHDLRIKEKSKDPIVAAEAKTILDEFFKRWAFAVKKEYEQMRGFRGEGTQPALKELLKKQT
jgi:hypothetical protein